MALMSFPEGFLRHERDERRIRSFLIDSLHLDPAADLESAALAAYMSLGQKQQQEFQVQWQVMLRALIGTGSR